MTGKTYSANLLNNKKSWNVWIILTKWTTFLKLCTKVTFAKRNRSLFQRVLPFLIPVKATQKWHSKRKIRFENLRRFKCQKTKEPDQSKHQQSKSFKQIPQYFSSKGNCCRSEYFFKQTFKNVKRLRKFSSALKDSTITPVYSKGEKQLVKTYRPLPFLNFDSKVFWKCLFDLLGLRFSSFVSKHQH